MNGTIKGRILCRERVEPQKTIRSPLYDLSTTFFLENRNLHNLPSMLRGCVCAIRDVHSDNVEDFKLCFIYKADHEKDVVHYLEWIGPAIKTRGENETIAEFQMLNRNSLDSPEHLRKHFRLHTIRMKDKEFIFLNKVAGWDFLLILLIHPIQKINDTTVKRRLLWMKMMVASTQIQVDRTKYPPQKKSIGSKLPSISAFSDTDYYVRSQKPLAQS